MAQINKSGVEVQIEETTSMAVIHDLAHAIWYPTYQSILSKEQIEYMLEQIYAVPSLEKQLVEGQVFLLLEENRQPVAFAAFSLLEQDEKVYKLNKIYIHPAKQGNGYGELLLAEVIKRCIAEGGKILELNVHRENPARHFYQKKGFTIHQTVDIPFGPFTLNDYVMRRPL
ncbi:GNAT family N-acetyltransferase [Rufibacter roseus]|uniref:GNAT family N-acetyltransferase n=1 Tax=Rufibacter roseus TaxID=1567108 RepID=A0ABW2DJP5_9BACT|nr:GNAT family N-acetyltransferase [Rufibacter roseus]